jgi:hypothetical protein
MQQQCKSYGERHDRRVPAEPERSSNAFARAPSSHEPDPTTRKRPGYFSPISCHC